MFCIDTLSLRHHPQRIVVATCSNAGSTPLAKVRNKDRKHTTTAWVFLLWSFKDRIDFVVRDWCLLNDAEKLAAGRIRKPIQAAGRLTNKLRKRRISFTADCIVHQRAGTFFNFRNMSV